LRVHRHKCEMEQVMGNNVVIAGWGQITQAKDQMDRLLDPLGLMVEASRRAAESTTMSNVLQNIDAVFTVKVMSEYYLSAAAQLADALGAAPRLTLTSSIGGNSPQSLINKAAGMIARGELDSVLIAGGETYCPRKDRFDKTGSLLFKGLEGGHESEDMIGASDLEKRHGIHLPVHGFPLFETALWGASGLPIEAYLNGVGRMWRRFSSVAAAHPNSWTRTPRSIDEIITPGPANRRVAFPYTKYMTSLISVDMAAAVLLMSDNCARRICPGTRRPVYFLAGADARDRQRFMADKSSFTTSPALSACICKVFRRAGLFPDDIQCFDLYSCFPCSVTIARKALGLENTDERPLTVTGGLGFFGGPGNNYSLHAAAAMAENISHGTFDTGMITSLGWFMHKHSAGIFSAIPRETGLRHFDLEDEADPLAGSAPEITLEQVDGTGIVETYTVLFSRDGSPYLAVLYGKTPEGLRFVAQAIPEPDTFSELTRRCRIGDTVRLRYNPKTNLNSAAFI
jgi:acetyl-CoA C-acetyltransferase